MKVIRREYYNGALTDEYRFEDSDVLVEVFAANVLREKGKDKFRLTYEIAMVSGWEELNDMLEDLAKNYTDYQDKRIWLVSWMNEFVDKALEILKLPAPIVETELIFSFTDPRTFSMRISITQPEPEREYI
ncbi:MAG: hypothetical protein QW517_08585 [Thermofilaceae archaeon]